MPTLGEKLKLFGDFNGLSASPDLTRSVHEPQYTSKLPTKSKKRNQPKSVYVFLDLYDRYRRKDPETVPQSAAVFAAVLGMIVHPNVIVPHTRVMVTGDADNNQIVKGTLSKQIEGFRPAVNGYVFDDLPIREFASMTVGSYWLAEDDLHNGNWGFDCNGKIARLDFDRTGFDVTCASKGLDIFITDIDRLMQFPNAIFEKYKSLKITPDDLISFPILEDFKPTNWFYQPIHCKSHVNLRSKFVGLQNNPEFIKWKWFYFLKILLIKPRQLEYHSTVNCIESQHQKYLNSYLALRKTKLALNLILCDEFKEYLKHISEDDLRQMLDEMQSYDEQFKFKQGVDYNLSLESEFKLGEIRKKYHELVFSLNIEELKTKITNIIIYLDNTKNRINALKFQISELFELFEKCQKGIKFYTESATKTSGLIETPVKKSNLEQNILKIGDKELYLNFFAREIPRLQSYLNHIFSRIELYSKNLGLIDRGATIAVINNALIAHKDALESEHRSKLNLRIVKCHYYSSNFSSMKETLDMMLLSGAADLSDEIRTLISFYYGQYFFQQRMFPEAIDKFLACQRIDYIYSEAAKLLVHCYIETGQDEKVMEILSNTSKLASDNSLLHIFIQHLTVVKNFTLALEIATKFYFGHHTVTTPLHPEKLAYKFVTKAQIYCSHGDSLFKESNHTDAIRKYSLGLKFIRHLENIESALSYNLLKNTLLFGICKSYLSLNNAELANRFLQQIEPSFLENDPDNIRSKVESSLAAVHSRTPVKRARSASSEIAKNMNRSIIDIFDKRAPKTI